MLHQLSLEISFCIMKEFMLDLPLVTVILGKGEIVVATAVIIFDNIKSHLRGVFVYVSSALHILLK